MKDIELHCDLLRRDITEDTAKLRAYFTVCGPWIGPLAIEALRMHLSPDALVNLGLLSKDHIGRWDDGYAPAGSLAESIPSVASPAAQ